MKLIEHDTVDPLDLLSDKIPSQKKEQSFLLRNKRKIMSVIAGGIVSGCGGGDGTSPQIPGDEKSTDRSEIMAASVPITSVPTSAPFEVDGMIGYGWIYFEHPITGYANGPYINPFQANSYNPRDVLTKLGTTEWIIVRASFTYDADRNNDGKADTTWTPINSSMSMLVHRSVLERGEKIIFSPRSAFISEAILSREGRILSEDALNSVARASSVDDTNNDGIINMNDVTSKKWSIPGSPALSLPGFSSYMESIYTNNGPNRGSAIKTLQKMQNHSILKIVANPANHDPMLKIDTIGNATILYTLDGSTPLPDGATTQRAASGITLPLQAKKIYFRELIGNAPNQILSRVRSFDLATDWMELAQEGQGFNPSGKETLDETSYTYSGKNYIIRAVSNKTSPGYTYPKFLDCQVGGNQADGCNLGPYVAYNEVHEAKIRELIHSAAQAFITSSTTTPPGTTPPSGPGTTPTAPTHYQNELTSYISKTSYLGGWYEVQNQWNISGTKDFPVTILGMYATPDGVRQANITSTATTEAERLSFSQSMVARLKAIIEAKAANLPKPTYPQNYIIPSSPVVYKGYSYTLITTMNTTGYSDYPASVKVSYTTPNGPKETPVLPAKDANELATVQVERINEAKSQIDMSLGLDEYAPSYVAVLTPRKYYAGGSYKTTFTYSGTIGKDYPGYIDVSYRRSDGSTGKWTMQVSSETQRNLFVPQGEAQAKLEIDNFPLHPINDTKISANMSYGTKGGTYTQYTKYNRVGTGYNFPALVWFEYRATSTSPLQDTRNTYGVTEARNSEHLAEIVSTLESWVRGQMVAQSPSDSSTKYATTTGSRILDMLLRSAHAADTPSSIVVKNTATKITPLSPYSADISFFRAYNFGNATQEFFMKPGYSAPVGKSKVNVVGKTEEEARLKKQRNDAEVRYYEMQTELIDRLNHIREVNKGLNTCTGYGVTIGNCTPYSPYDLFPSPQSSNQGNQEMALMIGEDLFGKYATNTFKPVIDEIQQKYSDNFLLMYAIIIEEQSHLVPPIFEDAVLKGSVGLSQITVIPSTQDAKYFGFTTYNINDLLDPVKHLAIMNNRLNVIKNKLQIEGIAITPENIGRVWNGGYNCRKIGDLCPVEAINYGYRVRDYADNLFKYYKIYSGK